MNQKHHNRSSSHGRKLPGHARPARPQGLHRRGHSYHHTTSHSHASNSASKPAAGSSKRSVATEVVSQDDEDETGMASFLQFCATCEKQIVTPGSSILYCSERCRRKDVSRLEPIQTLHSPSAVPHAASYFDMPPPDIMPQRSPTVVRPVSLTFSDLTISDAGLSPTRDFHEDDGENEASRYLSQFHSQSYTESSHPKRRPRMNRSSTAGESGIPSLSHTPSSSVGTAASASSYRALPRRHPTHGQTQSIDLVTPVYPNAEPSSPTQLMKDSSLKSSASTLTSFNVAEAGDVSFRKREPSWSWRRDSQGGGSLKQLFSHDAMKSAPREK